jgi:L-iditol 2-dehydrogenase
MKKIVLSDLRKFSISDEPKPEISSDTDVLVKISSVGICGSDVHYFKTGRIGDHIIKFPFTLGHEFSGIIESVGSKVKKILPGDRIAIDPAISCGICDQCQQGRAHTCRNLKFIGNPSELEGALKEYMVIPQECCFKLPETLTLSDGVIIEPFTIGLHAVDFNVGRENIAILGSGPIGISTLLALKYKFPDSNVFVTDKIDERLLYASNKGAYWTGNPLKTNIVDEILKEIPQGMDTVFECCGQQEAITQAIELLKPGGQLIVVGIPEEYNVSFDAHTLRRKEISIQNVRRQNDKCDEAIEILEKKAINLDGFISHKFHPDKIQEAFELVEAYKDGVIKAVIEF